MIPPYTPHGILPPFLGDPTSPVGRSPFDATIDEVVDHFSTTSRRRAILAGLLGFRAALRAAGMTAGAQWLDGSFAENRGGEPNDVDVVTFHMLTPAEDAAFAAGHPELASSRRTKVSFHVDAYFVPLRRADPWRVVPATAYGYGLFGHQRVTERWKGMVQVRLDSPDDDASARRSLAARMGGTP
jgi:hypothetical protein